MKLEDQVCSLDLARKLEKLGVKQDSLFQWAIYETQDGKYSDENYRLVSRSLQKHADCRDRYIAAFTVAEMGEMMPVELSNGWTLLINRWVDTWQLEYEKLGEFLAEESQRMTPLIDEPKEADARAKMLIYLIEKGLVKP